MLDNWVTADNFDKQLDKFCRFGDFNRDLLIDFQKAEFIEIAVLVNCISLITQRTRNKQNTFIACPKKKEVRDFLIVWRFLEAIKDATNNDISNFLVYENQDFINEIPETYTGKGSGIRKLEFDSDWNPSKSTTRNFFEFTTFKDSNSIPIGPQGRLVIAPREEGKKWTRPLIQQILERYLPGRTTKDEIARVIIYEAMSNAVRHPQASIIQSVSHLERNDNNGTISGYLRICFWDDGKGIAQTLTEALNEGRPIRAFQIPTYMSDKVFVELRNFKEESKGDHVVDLSLDLPVGVPEPKLLLASLSAGVTSSLKKDSPAQEVLPFDEKKEPNKTISDLMDLLGTAPGMGLYALMRTALDQFAGSLLIRSGRYRLIIRIAHDGYRVPNENSHYKCKITQYESYVPPFLGNLLVVQLPISPLQNKEQ